MGGEHGCAVAKLQVSEVGSGQQRSEVTFEFMPLPVPPVGFEPTLTAPEAVALSPELRGLRTPQDYQSRRACRAAGRGRGTGHPGSYIRFPARSVAGSAGKTLPSRPWRRDWDECSWWTTMR